MAPKRQANPLLQKLQAQGAAAFDAGKTKKNPFADLDCPDGSYYCQITKAHLAEVFKDKNPAIVLQLIIVCAAQGAIDDPEALQEGDTTYAGLQPKINMILAASAKRTLQEAWESAFFTFQTLGYDTSKMVLDESEIESEDQFSLSQLLEELSLGDTYCKVSISENKNNPQYRNVNIRDAIDKDSLQQLLSGELPSSSAEDDANDADADEVADESAPGESEGYEDSEYVDAGEYEASEEEEVVDDTPPAKPSAPPKKPAPAKKAAPPPPKKVAPPAPHAAPTKKVVKKVAR